MSTHSSRKSSRWIWMRVLPTGSASYGRASKHGQFDRAVKTTRPRTKCRGSGWSYETVSTSTKHSPTPNHFVSPVPYRVSCPHPVCYSLAFMRSAQSAFPGPRWSTCTTSGPRPLCRHNGAGRQSQTPLIPQPNLVPNIGRQPHLEPLFHSVELSFRGRP